MMGTLRKKPKIGDGDVRRMHIAGGMTNDKLSKHHKEIIVEMIAELGDSKTIDDFPRFYADFLLTSDSRGFGIPNAFRSLEAYLSKEGFEIKTRSKPSYGNLRERVFGMLVQNPNLTSHELFWETLEGSKPSDPVVSMQTLIGWVYEFNRFRESLQAPAPCDTANFREKRQTTSTSANGSLKRIIISKRNEILSSLLEKETNQAGVCVIENFESFYADFERECELQEIKCLNEENLRRYIRENTGCTISKQPRKWTQKDALQFIQKLYMEYPDINNDETWRRLEAAGHEMNRKTLNNKMAILRGGAQMRMGNSSIEKGAEECNSAVFSQTSDENQNGNALGDFVRIELLDPETL